MAVLSRRQNITLRLGVVPVAALVASHVVFSQVFPGQAGYQFPWAYFLTVVTVMLSCWEVNLAVFDALDNRLPFRINPLRRLLYQFLIGGSATLLTFAIVFPLAQRIYTQHWPTTPTLLKGITVCITLATFVNGGYVGLYLLQAFFRERQQKAVAQEISDSLPTAKTDTVEGSQTLVTIEVATGQLRLPIDEIAYFYSTGGLVLLVKTTGQQVVTRYSSFVQLAPLLTNDYFFQLSRQFVAGLGAVRAVQDDANRKLIVSLAPALHKQNVYQTVMVSRYRNLELRKWLQPTVLP